MASRPRPEKKEIAFPRRGEIYLVGFDPTVGHEIEKTRPAVVIQNGISNQHSPIAIVAAMLGVVAGSVLGARHLVRLRTLVLRRVFGVVVALIAIEMIYNGILRKV